MSKERSNKKHQKLIISVILAIVVVLAGWLGLDWNNISNEITASNTNSVTTELSFSLEDISDYSGSPYVVINNNIPDFDEADYTTTSFEKYSNLDTLGRCGVAYACIGQDIMPTEEREDLDYNPTGWVQEKYNGEYLYNRCHLIGFQLAGENDNEKNLMTGTRYLNIEGMLDFENEVADYVTETNNHVLYRVTPIFEENNLLANGVQMEAYSVEDHGEGIEFNVYCYNVQPNIELDYATGNSYEIN